jgi:hypothetical protein
MIDPSLADWRALHAAAAAFKELAAWRWMADSDLFGVEDPETREVSWCCVLGQLGQIFALAAYPGAAGLDFYRRVEGGEIDPEEAFFGQRCLMASFGEKRELDKKDHEVIRALGLKFRGPNEWPCFRSYEPSYLPWHLDREQARRLTLVLEQSIDVAARCRQDELTVAPDRSKRFLVRTTRADTGPFAKKKSAPSRGPGAALAWRDVRRQLPPLPTRPAPPTLDLERLRAIRAKVEEVDTTWELDAFHLPIPIARGKARPFYPRVLLVVDRRDGFVVHVELDQERGVLELARDELPKAIQKAGVAPTSVAVARTEIREAVEPTCKALGCRLGMVDEMEKLAEAKESLIEAMTGE